MKRLTDLEIAIERISIRKRSESRYQGTTRPEATTKRHRVLALVYIYDKDL